jgi:flagellar motor switch protein FliM
MAKAKTTSDDPSSSSSLEEGGRIPADSGAAGETAARSDPGSGDLGQSEADAILAQAGLQLGGAPAQSASPFPSMPSSPEPPVTQTGNRIESKPASDRSSEPASFPSLASGNDSGMPPSSTLSEVLSQSEVERLLTQVQAEETTATVLRSGGVRARLKNEDVQPCDFRQPAFLTGGELRKIRLRHEEFIRSLAAHLSIYLRLEVVIHMSKLQTLSFQKYTEALPNPTHLTLFKVEPLKGICLLDMSPRLGLTVVDRLLGGPAHSVNFNGELSEIETALLDQVAQLILNEWCQLWQRIESPHPVVLGHENNGRFLNSSAHDSVMLILSMEFRLGDCVEQAQLAFPFLTIEPLVRQASQDEEEESGMSVPKPGRPVWNPSYDEIPVHVNTRWKGMELTARALTTLKCGDVLMLDANCLEQVEVLLEQLPWFHARLGTSGDRWAVELTGAVK